MSSSPIDSAGFTRVPSGIAGLDTILGGGFMLGGIYIIQGAPGAGKTILSNQICFNHIATGGRAMFVTLLAENHARMTANLRGLAFFDERRIPDQLSYVSAYTEMREGGLKGLVDVLRREIRRKRCTMLVIDGLVSAQAIAETEQAFKQFVHDLQEIALATDCTMFVTTNAGRPVSPEQTMVDGLIELNDRAYGWRAESDLQVRKFRGSGFLRGRHAYKITTDGIVIHPRLEALLAQPSRSDDRGDQRVPSGIDRLDTLMGGALPAASTTMVMGPSGTGKTTLGLQFLAASSPDEPGLLFGFYETPGRLMAKAENVCPRLTPLFAAGTVELLWQTPGSDLIDAYGELLLRAVHRRRVKRLFIDGLMAFKSAASDPLRLEPFFSALSIELRVLGVTTLYSLEVPDILGPALRIPIGDVSALAENVILLRFIELRSQLYRLISILKIRDSGFDPSLHEFTITDHGIEIRDSSESAEAILSSLVSGDRERPAGKGGAPARTTKRGA